MPPWAERHTADPKQASTAAAQSENVWFSVWGSLVIRVLPQIPWHEVVCLEQSVNASHAPVLPSSAVLFVVDEREAEVFGRLAGHAKIRAGWLAATADQQFS